MTSDEGAANAASWQAGVHLRISPSSFLKQQKQLKKQLVFRARANSPAPRTEIFMGITFDFIDESIVITQRTRRSASLPIVIRRTS
ncbi:MAG: hypothetical protein IKR48_01915 [Kiritimatiellae bacterium]|nr:hypothetical protein [Kiritimatiellia bacterium]